MPEPREIEKGEKEFVFGVHVVEHHMLWTVLAIIGLLFLWHAMAVPAGTSTQGAVVGFTPDQDYANYVSVF